MPEFCIVLSSVAEHYVEANSMEEAIVLAENISPAELDWASNTCVESVDQVEAGEA